MAGPEINAGRLLGSIAEMARIGATEKGGVCRLALSDEDRAGRDLFVQWAKAAGCAVEIDEIGNIFARRPGRDNRLAPVLLGSHLDSQPTGGKYDGAYGVLAALELVRSLDDAGLETLRPVEAVCWTNEEGARFAPAMMGSGAFTGALDLDEILGGRDLDGRTVGEELRRIGYAGARACRGHDAHAYFEAHIEQGPILEAESKVIGVVEGIQGIRWFDCRLEGAEGHAGPTPMDRRRDALLGAARLVERINRIARDHAPAGRATVGQFQLFPNSRNVIPGEAKLTVDMRHPDPAALAEMAESLHRACEVICAEAGLRGAVDEIWYSPPTAFDSDCIAAVRRATEAAGYPHMAITSGAGHDAKYLADICPTAMVFIPCKDGISHNEREEAAPDHLVAGCQVLLHAALDKANEAG